jgi:hypothetical protein
MKMLDKPMVTFGRGLLIAGAGIMLIWSLELNIGPKNSSGAETTFHIPVNDETIPIKVGDFPVMSELLGLSIDHTPEPGTPCVVPLEIFSEGPEVLKAAGSHYPLGNWLLDGPYA